MFEGTMIEKKKKYYYNVSDVNIGIFYKCLDKNCSLQPEDKDKFIYNFILRNQIFNLDLQNKTHPLELGEMYLEKGFLIDPSSLRMTTARWEIIKVKEEKGLFDNFIGNKKEIIGGQLSENFVTDSLESEIGENPFNIPYKLIYNFKIAIDFHSFVEYKRKEISIIDIIANICSLSLTIYNGFRFGFSFFYSQNFDNYKIIDKILTSKGKRKEKKINDTKFDKSFPLLNVNEMNEEEEEKDVDKINLITDTESEKNEDSLPKYHFFNFIFNFFSCKCCQRGKIQKSITICNNIIERYYSIENLIYSQFMLENLLKDYKWNNPYLNTIKNNELIYKLEQIIKTEGILQ